MFRLYATKKTLYIVKTTIQSCRYSMKLSLQRVHKNPPAFFCKDLVGQAKRLFTSKFATLT